LILQQVVNTLDLSVHIERRWRNSRAYDVVMILSQGLTVAKNSSMLLVGNTSNDTFIVIHGS